MRTRFALGWSGIFFRNCPIAGHLPLQRASALAILLLVMGLFALQGAATNRPTVIVQNTIDPISLSGLTTNQILQVLQQQAKPAQIPLTLVLITNADRTVTIQTNNTANLRPSLNGPKPVIQIHQNGATARNAGHTVEFDGNLNHAEAITIIRPGQEILKGHIT